MKSVSLFYCHAKNSIDRIFTYTVLSGSRRTTMLTMCPLVLAKWLSELLLLGKLGKTVVYMCQTRESYRKLQPRHSKRRKVYLQEFEP